jgi:hemolysin III
MSMVGPALSTSMSFPGYTRGERVADACIHVAGVSASIIGASMVGAIAFSYLAPQAAASASIYAVGLVAVFCFSAAYHLSRGPRLKAILRRFDHAAIYIKIAATYTPFAVVKIGGAAGFGLLGAVWLVALVGASAKLIVPGQFVRTAYVLYLAQGWAGLVVMKSLFLTLSTTALALLIAGGVLYTVGVVFHLWQRLPYHNAIWHGFVLTASACHFGAIVNALTT